MGDEMNNNRYSLTVLNVISILFLISMPTNIYCKNDEPSITVIIHLPKAISIGGPNFQITDLREIEQFVSMFKRNAHQIKKSEYLPYIEGEEYRGGLTIISTNISALPQRCNIWPNGYIECYEIIEDSAINYKYYKDTKRILESWLVRLGQEKNLYPEYYNGKSMLKWYENVLININKKGNNDDNGGKQGSDNESSPQLKDKNKKKPKDSTEEPGAGDGNSNGAIKEDSPKQTIDESETGPGFYWYILFAAVFLIIALLTIIIRRRCSDNG